MATTTQNGNSPPSILDGLNIPCGCGNRKDIIGAASWQNDAIILGVIVAIPLAILAYKKWGI